MLGSWIAKSLDEPFGQFAGVLFESRADVAPGVAAVLAALKDANVADGLQLDNVVEGSPLYQALIERGATDTVTSDAVYVDMRACSSFENYAESINKKTRKNLRNLLNRLKRTGDVQHIVADDRQRIGAMLTQTFDARLDWMHQYARTSPAFRDSDFVRW